MGIRVLDVGGKTVIAGRPAVRLLEGPDDLIDLLGAGFEHGARSLLLYAENLPERRYQVLLENARRFAAGEPLRNVVDKAAWY